jgi:ligand-binding SRPBCC domain-containing protein
MKVRRALAERAQHLQLHVVPNDMPTLELTTMIGAPVERVFDLARSIDLHVKTAGSTGERAIAGVTTGLIGPGQQVTWRARHFGVWQSLTVKITAFDSPRSFTDAMINGAFQRMEHHHYFEPCVGGTLMRDVFLFESPLGILGRIADALVLTRYMKGFLKGRNGVLRRVAESGEWKKYLGREGPEVPSPAD